MHVVQHRIGQNQTNNLLHMNIVKSLILGFFVMGFMTMTAFSQDTYKASMEGWHVKMDEAYAQSQASGKPILANFTGTDWCAWCKRLRASVFDTKEFQVWAAENVVLLELDFPRRKQVPQEIKQQNQQLQQAFKVRGYPTVWVFNLDKNKDGKFNIEALGSTGYQKSPDEFIANVEKMIANGKQGK